MEEKKLVPKLRFPGFTEPWEQRKLDEVFQIIDGDRGKNYPGTGDFLSNGDVLFLDTGNVRKDGFNFDNKRYIDFNRDKLLRNGRLILGDYVLTSRGTLGNLAYYSQSIYNRYPHIRINSAMLILRMMNTIKVNNLYLYITLRSNVINEFMKHNFVGSAQPHITKKEFSSVLLPIPRQLEEQKIIGDFFDKLEKIITLHQRKLEHLKLKKKSLLQKLFPKEGEVYPELRFPGFTDPWEQRKLADVANIVMGQSPSSQNYTDNPNDDILVQGNADLIDGQVVPRLWTKEITKSIDEGNIVMTVRAPVGDVAKTAYKVVLGRGVTGIKGDEYIYQFLLKLKYNHYWRSLSSGSTFESINSNDIKNLIIDIPCDEERTKIGNLLSTTDTLITLHQRKLEHLQLLKKALLQQLFV